MDPTETLDRIFKNTTIRTIKDMFNILNNLKMLPSNGKTDFNSQFFLIDKVHER